MEEKEPLQIIERARRVLAIEADAINALSARIDGAFYDACCLIKRCAGRLVVTGMGKSGHIARKIAATLASTGTPAFYVHPGEAAHGDLGMITSQDVVLALSNSGESDEIIALQVLVTTALPIISTSAGAQLCVALDAAIIRATAVLKAADYAPDEIATVIGILAAWREDMGESAGAAGASTCH
mgnify:CR=1 FL=1